MIQLEGWFCPACYVFNGEEKAKRLECRSCGGSRVASEGLTRQELFRIIKGLVIDNVAMHDNVTAMQEKLGRYIECAQAAKAAVDPMFGRLDGQYVPLAEAVRRLEEDPATHAAMQRPPTVAGTVTGPEGCCARCLGTKRVRLHNTDGGVEVDCPECACPR